MSVLLNAVTRPHRLQWWQWGQIVGVVLPVLFFYLGVRHPLLWALAAHFFLDFTAQSNVTSAGKAQGKLQTVAYHAFISGGYTGMIVAGLPGLALSIITHFLVDITNKFGLDEPLGPALDQSIHIFTLVAIWWMIQF